MAIDVALCHALMRNSGARSHSRRHMRCSLLVGLRPDRYDGHVSNLLNKKQKRTSKILNKLAVKKAGGLSFILHEYTWSRAVYSLEGNEVNKQHHE
jgi:hypothetical protein